ncbi:MAG: type I secretion system permease/ATPase [Arcobacter sp.]|nr:type I secretion system permease/ATPase [Arcobacter sp.]
MQSINPKGNTVFETLVLYASLHDISVKVESISAGLPRDYEKEINIPKVASVIKAGKKIGLNIRLAKENLEDISSLVLPVMIVFKNGSSGLFMGFEDDKAKILLASSGESLHLMDKESLKDEYSGYIFYLGKTFKKYHENVHTKKHSEHWLWHTLKLSFPIYRDILLASFVINVFALASPLFTMNVYDRVVPNFATYTLWTLAIGVIVVILIDGILKFLRTHFIEIAAKKSDVIISSKLYERVMGLKMEAAPTNVGAFASNMREFDSIKNFLTSSVMLFIVDLPFTLLFLFVIYYIGGLLVIVPITLMFVLLAYTLAIKKPLFKSIEASFEESTRKNAILIESIAGLRDIKLLNATGKFQWMWEQIVGSLAQKGVKSRFLSSSISTVTGILVSLDSILIVAFGVYLINDGLLSMGGLIAVVILASRTIAPIGQVAALISQYEQTKVAYNSLENLMNLQIETEDGKEFLAKDDIKGDLEFKNVSFTYPNEQRPALQNVSFKIKQGERIAFVGRNGSGKSTILKLLMGLYKPNEGTILLDNLDIGEFHPSFLRKEFAIMPQDFILYTGSLRENITLKNPNASDVELLNALKIGALENFVQDSKFGLNMPILEKGGNLSGGQKQSIALARTFIAPFKVAILDEPTSSMDGLSEQMVSRALAVNTKDKTFIVASHKNSLLALVDRVLVVDEGKIVFDNKKEVFIKQFLKIENETR